MPEKTIYHRMKNLNTRMVANYNRGFCQEKAMAILHPIREQNTN